MVMSQDQNSGRSHHMTTDNSSFDRVEVFMYWGTTLTNQNSIQEEFYVLLTVHLGIIFVNN